VLGSPAVGPHVAGWPKVGPHVSGWPKVGPQVAGSPKTGPVQRIGLGSGPLQSGAAPAAGATPSESAVNAAAIKILLMTNRTLAESARKSRRSQ
jgi:hypothetical protein